MCRSSWYSNHNPKFVSSKTFASINVPTNFLTSPSEQWGIIGLLISGSPFLPSLVPSEDPAKDVRCIELHLLRVLVDGEADVGGGRARPAPARQQRAEGLAVRLHQQARPAALALEEGAGEEEEGRRKRFFCVTAVLI